MFPEMQEPTGLHPHSMIHPWVGLYLPRAVNALTVPRSSHFNASAPSSGGHPASPEPAAATLNKWAAKSLNELLGGSSSIQIERKEEKGASVKKMK